MSSSTNHQRYPRTSCANCQADYRLLNEAAAKSSLLDLTVGQLERLRTIYATRPEKLTQALAEQLKSEVVEVTIIAEEWRITRYLAFRNGRFGDLIRQFAASNRIEDHRSVLFWFKGKLVEEEDTPQSLNFQSKEVILAHVIEPQMLPH